MFDVITEKLFSENEFTEINGERLIKASVYTKKHNRF